MPHYKPRPSIKRWRYRRNKRLKKELALSLEKSNDSSPIKNINIDIDCTNLDVNSLNTNNDTHLLTHFSLVHIPNYFPISPFPFLSITSTSEPVPTPALTFRFSLASFPEHPLLHSTFKIYFFAFCFCNPNKVSFPHLYY